MIRVHLGVQGPSVHQISSRVMKADTLGSLGFPMTERVWKLAVQHLQTGVMADDLHAVGWTRGPRSFVRHTDAIGALDAPYCLYAPPDAVILAEASGGQDGAIRALHGPSGGVYGGR